MSGEYVNRYTAEQSLVKGSFMFNLHSPSVSTTQCLVDVKIHQILSLFQ